MLFVVPALAGIQAARFRLKPVLRTATSRLVDFFKGRQLLATSFTIFPLTFLGSLLRFPIDIQWEMLKFDEGVQVGQKTES